MPKEQTIDRIATKFQRWAETLSKEEQEALASWMVHRQKEGTRGFSAEWYSAPNAWEQAFKALHSSS